MKARLFLFFLLTSMSLSIFAQMNISTNLRQDCIWDEKKEDWTVFSTNEEERTFFEFNKEFTMFKHTTASMTSAYVIKSSEHDESLDQYELDIVSDVGNEYLMIIDVDNNNLRFIYEKDGDLLMVLHTIKSLWFNEGDLEDKNEENISSSTIQASSGTGFAISSNGYIVTNYHVIEGAESIEVKGINGNFKIKLSAEIAVADEKNDLAIIKINNPNFTTLGNIPYTIKQTLADVGESVYVLGYPMTSTMGEEVKLTNGIVSSKTGFQGDISMYQISAPVQPGNSGGPLFDKNGNLLGIVSAKHMLAENASYAIKASYLKNLIDMLPQSINQPTTNSLNGKDLTEQVKIASNYTYLIVVNDNDHSPSSPNSSVSQENSSESEQKAAVYYQKAEELWEHNDSRGALEQINLSIDASPNYSGSYFFRGFIYLYGIRNFEKAVEDFTKSIQMQPDFEGAFFYRGMASYNLEKNIDAIKDFTKVISMNKDNTDAYFMRALIKSNMSDRQGAISDYDEIIKREKSATPSIYKMSTVYNNKAYCLVELDKPSEALPFVTKALDIDESEGYIWDTRGEIYFKLGDYEKCIKDMNKAISIDGEADNSYYLRGLAKIKLGRKQDGCEDLSKAGELGEAKAYEAISTYCK